MQEYKTIKDLIRVLSLFNSTSIEELSAAEISRMLDMSFSKISRMLRTLEREGIVERDNKTGKYRLGILVFELGIIYAYHHPLRKIFRPHLEQMAHDIQLTASWGILSNNRVIVLDRVQNLPIDVLGYRVGLNLPIHTTSIGKILMAYLMEEDLNEILLSIDLIKPTKNSIIDINKIKENLKLYKSQGYSYDDEETYEGIHCIGTPIMNDEGQAIAGISILDEKERTSRNKLMSYVDYLKNKALFISRQLGYSNVAA